MGISAERNTIILKSEAENALEKFICWLDKFGELSFDRMDYWSSQSGIKAKRIYYRNKLAGAPLAIWGLLLENYLPGIQKLYAVPRREAIGDAHYSMAFLNLYELTKNKGYLARAERYLDHLVESRCSNYENYCWGYTFGWETKNGFLPPSTPFITVTPYPFWAFRKHYQITGENNSLKICRSVAEFAIMDLKKVKVGELYSTSYSPIDTSPIINANSYRAALLCDAYNIFAEPAYHSDALENIDFVIHNQKSDGRWYYEAGNEIKSFIDNFHTCFVLRNLAYCNKHLNENRIKDSILKGYDFYLHNLINKQGFPRHFAVSNNLKLRKYEMYDFAEGIKLGCLLKEEIPGAFELAQSLARELIYRYQTKEGYFVTRVSQPGLKHKVPYHRWPQAQLFYSLTEILKSLS